MRSIEKQEIITMTEMYEVAIDELNAAGGKYVKPIEKSRV